MQIPEILLFLNGEALNFCNVMTLPEFFQIIWEIWLSPGKNGENVCKFIAIFRIFRNLSQFIAIFFGPRKTSISPPTLANCFTYALCFH